MSDWVDIVKLLEAAGNLVNVLRYQKLCLKCANPLDVHDDGVCKEIQIEADKWGLENA